MPHDEPLRVLYVTRAPFVGGAERALEVMLRGLDGRRVKAGVVCGCEGDVARNLRATGAPVWIVPLAKRHKWGVLPWRRSLARMRRVIGEFRPHVLHANDVPSCQAVSVLGQELGIPRVMHVRERITADQAAWWARCGAEAVLCISRYIRGELGDLSATALCAAEVEVLPDAVAWAGEPPESPRRVEDSGSPRRLEDSPSRGLGALRLGYVGRIGHSKGLDLVIEAMAQLPAELRPTLRVAGSDAEPDGQYRQQLQAFVRQHGLAERIQWLGFTQRIDEDVYGQVDAVVCPSRLEGLGLVPLEAAAFGVPALANRLGGFLETIEDRVTGWLVEPTVAAWAAALSNLASMDGDVRCAAGAAAHRRTRERYSPMEYQRRLMAVYGRLGAPAG